MWSSQDFRLPLVVVFSDFSPEELVVCSRVCKLWHDAALKNALWRPHVLQRWPNFVGAIPKGRHIPEAYFARIFSQRRSAMLGDDRQIAIENCVSQLFEFRCPVKWSALHTTDDATVRLCKECNKKVYLADTVDRVEQLVQAGECMAIQLDKKLPDWDNGYQYLGEPYGGRDATLIMQLLRDNLTLWTKDMTEEEGDGDQIA